jgi:hypothetical protein
VRRSRKGALRVYAWAAAALALNLGLQAAGCGPSQEKLEADRVTRAIDVLRDAPPEPLSAREALVTDLERQQASFPLAIQARDACARAYRLLIEGKALQASVTKALATPGGATIDTLRDLAGADAKIKESAAAMPECDRASADLRRPHAAKR